MTLDSDLARLLSEIDLELWAEARASRTYAIDVAPILTMRLQEMLGCVSNPSPTLAEAMHDESTADERAEVERLLRPVIERGDSTMPESWAHLTTNLDEPSIEATTTAIP